MDVGTYGGVTKVAFGDSLKQSRFAHVCKTDLQNSVSCIREAVAVAEAEAEAEAEGRAWSCIQFHSSSYYPACPAEASPP